MCKGSMTNDTSDQKLDTHQLHCLLFRHISDTLHTQQPAQLATSF